MGDLEQALASIQRALGGDAMHVNYGQSEDYARGFNDGYDAAESGTLYGQLNPPTNEPYSGAYRRGYKAGYDWAQDESTD